ncbi:MAG TPA: SGNH/GDSL hydrolase family protein [Magnetospirillum sp.]|nr:SGNH/GDSL hydrolase family protein [Magnetospirillum sp.]
MRKILSVAAVNLGLLLAMVVIAELVFGTWFSKEPLDQLGLVRDMSTTISAGPLYPGGQDFTYRRDHWGFRGAGVDPAQVTVLTVGGSTTNQLYLPDDATWQAVMARELRAHGHPVVIANAGIDGQSTIGHLRAMQDWFPHVPGLKPRFILFYVGINDVHADGGAVDKLQHASRVKWMRQHSALWQAGAKIAGMFTARRARLTHERVDFAAAQWTDKPVEPDWRDTATPAYRDRLRALARAAHAMGAVPVFVTQSRVDYKVVDGKVLGMVGGDELNGVDHYRRLSAFNDATRAVCVEERLLCLDLARELTFDPGDFYDYLHNTPQGAEKIGRWLAAKLAGLV